MPRSSADEILKYPITTGQAASVLHTTEPHLADQVRKGRIVPAPEVVAGRRLWQAEHVLKAAEVLGILTPDMSAKIGAVGGEVNCG